MPFFIRHILVLILLLTFIRSGAVVLEVRQDPGLPDKCINVICKDKHGLMWIGTQSGLCVYDGYEFKQLFTTALLNKEGIKRMAYSKEQDILFVATDRGLFKVQCNTFKIRMETNGLHPGNPVTALFAADNGHVYVAYKEGELIDMPLSGNNKKIAKIVTGDIRKIYPFDIRNDSGELMVTCTSSDIQYRYSVDRQSLSPASAYKPVSAGIRQDKNHIEFYNDNGAKLYTVDTILTPSLASFWKDIKNIGNIAGIQYASEDIVYVFSRPCSVYEINFKNHTCTNITSDIFTGRLARSFYTDQNNIIWLGTNKGLIKIITQPRLFKTSLVKYPTISIRTLCVDEFGNKYAGTYSGLFLLRKNETEWVKLGDQIPFSMINVKGRYVYFIEEEFHFYRIDKQTGKLDDHFYNKNNIVEKGNQTFAVTLDHKGIFWIGTNFGLATYNPETNMLQTFKVKEFSNENVEVRYIRVTADDKLLLCTGNGFYDLDPGTGKTLHLNTATRPALSSNTINFADIDDNGYVWLCAESGGVNILNAKYDSVRVLNTQSGLSSNTTYDILFNKGRAWISTYNGLSSCDIKSKAFYNFYATTNGLTDNEFNRNAFIADPKNHLFYFGTINGINSFNPDSIPIKPNAVKLFASTISKWDNNKRAYVNLPTLTSAKEIVLDPSDHSLNINIALSDYSNPEKVIFSYRVTGLVEEWTTLNGQHSIQLNGLAPGFYGVDIRAIDDHGLPAINELHYTIRVREPFFKTIWFYLLMLLFIIGIISYFFFMKIRNIKQITHIRQQIASDLHDEVGSMLTRITMNSDYLKYSKKADEETMTKLSRISALSRYAASSMNDILWTIDSRNNFTGNLADRIREHAVEMLSPMLADITFDIKVAHKESIDSETRQEIYLIFKEAINNIVKHSKATEVTICFYYNKSALLLKMENNGLYDEQKTSSIGQGVRNIKMRAHRIHASAKMAIEDGLFKVEVGKHISAFRKE